MLTSKTLTGGLVTLLAMTALAAPASAGPSTHTKFSISFERSALTTEAGTKRVYANLKREAEKACGLSDRAPLRVKRATEACVQTNMENFVRQINSQRLFSLHSRTQSLG